jgi:hypothetical protein
MYDIPPVSTTLQSHSTDNLVLTYIFHLITVLAFNCYFNHNCMILTMA